MDLTKISVIVPIYNREEYINSSLRSLISQRTDDISIHIIVVDDGSTDQSVSIITALEKEFGDIDLVSTPNKGISHARNVGLAKVPQDTDYISFLDSDDISPLGRFEADLAPLEQQPSLKFSYGKMLISHFSNTTSERELLESGLNVRSIQLAALLIKYEYAIEIGAFNEEFKQAEDTDYLLRVFENSMDYLLVDTICVYYRKHTGNISSRTDVNLRYFLKAVHLSIKRRRLNPNTGFPDGIFSNDARQKRF
ncbi:MAG: glycosyltransferase family 2 protein [Rhodothermales bacterium]